MTIPRFVIDPPALREARKVAALARLAHEEARAARKRSEPLRRKWVLAKARLAALEAQCAAREV